MKITVLGCWGAYPAPGEATSGYLLQTEQLNVLVDCGSGVLAQLFKYVQPEELDAVILSHYHHDHVADLGCLQYSALITSQLGKREVPLPIYGHTQSSKFKDLTYNRYTAGKEIQAGKSLQLGDLKMDFQETIHGEYNLAMRFEVDGKVFSYTGDTGYSEELIPFFEKSDLLLCEASLYQEQRGWIQGHLTSVEAGELGRQAQVSQLWLTHFPHYGDLQVLKQQAQHAFGGRVEVAGVEKVKIL